MSHKPLLRVITATRTSDGAGVTLYRSLGQAQGVRLDPFLMLDEFGSDNPNEYIAGFPPHPHRGFETVTYMLDGHMLHEDHLGNKGHLKSGGVQWMTAGRGIIHSEMPQQEEGLMRGFQLWINLPSHQKMKPAGYEDIEAGRIPCHNDPSGMTVKVIAGVFKRHGQVLTGPVSGVHTEPIFFDVGLPAKTTFVQDIPSEHNLYVYVYEGDLAVNPRGPKEDAQAQLLKKQGGVFGRGTQVELEAGKEGARFLFLAARPLNEPIVQYGPFVMNTREEIEQAIADYRNNELVTGTVKKKLFEGSYS